MKLNPLGAKVIIKEKTLQTESKSGIQIITNDQRLISLGEGTVEKAGPDCRYVEVGDTVVYWPNSTTPLPTRFGENFTVIHEADIVCVEEN